MRLRQYVISLDPNPGRMTVRGLSRWKGRPLLTIEEGARVTVSISLDRVLTADDQITGVALSVMGVQGAARFDERTIEVDVWGARPWSRTESYGDDYGAERWDGVQVQAATSDGNTRVLRFHVRTPSLSQDWRTRPVGTDSRVTDIRRQPLYDEQLATSQISFADATTFVIETS